MAERLIAGNQPCPACKEPNTLNTYREDKFGDEVDRCSCCGFEGVRLNHNACEHAKEQQTQELAINHNALTQKETFATLPESKVKHLRSQFDKRDTCSCGYEGLHALPIQGYSPHPSGWAIEGLEKKVWLFVICPNCDYVWSLTKLGASK